jgi:nucleoside-diphosphate-sugar epimerase
MRVVVTGATGNVGTSVLRALADDPEVSEIVGVARRLPRWQNPRTRWIAADVASDDMRTVFAGADAVVHLAWLIQPARDLEHLWRVNVEGSTRVFRAVAEAGVPALVYASSIGAYSPGPKDRIVDESWPTGGIRTNNYSREKVEVERRLDRFEREHPNIRVVRLRPALIFKRESATEQRRIFAGPFVPGSLMRPGLIPLVPEIPGLVFQAVHSYDIGHAYRLAAVGDAHGALNVAAPPALDMRTIARLLGARTFQLSVRSARALAALAFHARLTPIPPSWLDMGVAVPLLDAARAQQELGWQPQHSGEDAIADLLSGLRDAAGLDTPPLSPRTSGPGRIRELVGGLGARE